jgi:carbon monoxide dehydrogenase subunit G
LKFEHKVVVDAPRAKVLEFLGDFNRAAYCLPGLEELTELAPNTYEGRVKVRIGPLGLNVSGKAEVQRGSADDPWRVKGEGRDRRVGTTMTASVEALLAELGPDRTEMTLDADVVFAGRLAELGQPLIKRKADSYVKEFAENLKKAIAKA